MPELPEVETIRRDLEGEVVGASILRFESSWPKKVLPELDEVVAKVMGREILSVSRVGKVISIDLKGGFHLLMHLKLSGQILLRPIGAGEDKYVRHVLFLGDGREIRFADMRKFGYVRLMDSAEWSGFCRGFGPEPAIQEGVITGLFSVLGKRRVAVKTVLLDQKVLAGVGNIYANDALFLAGVLPSRPAHSLTADEVSKVMVALVQVLNEGLETRGASDNTYRDAFGEKGSYQDRFKVYGRTGEPCLNDCGNIILYEKLNGRGTFYCEQCQK